MKKIIKYLFLLTGGSFILASCNDFLDREPLDSVTPDNFFFTENLMPESGEMTMRLIIRLPPTMIRNGFPVNGKFRKHTIILQAMIRGISLPFVKLITSSKQ